MFRGKNEMRILSVSPRPFLHFSEHMYGLQQGREITLVGGSYHIPVQFTSPEDIQVTQLINL
jgi:hypothetical protein